MAPSLYKKTKQAGRESLCEIVAVFVGRGFNHDISSAKSIQLQATVFLIFQFSHKLPRPGSAERASALGKTSRPRLRTSWRPDAWLVHKR